ncbi:MAG: S-layer protein [Candidatus Aenigmarchaeota archaeon]|nr:S-layer protein [Candidatus Aenigmarchaeota archaeon]
MQNTTYEDKTKKHGGVYIMKAIKKIVALGVGLTMVGATIFGASAAYTLSQWPSPLVSDGTPASNLAIVVGDNAAASDVAGAIDIGVALQAAAITRTAIAGSKKGVTVEGDAVAIGSTSDLLEINETIGSVRETLTEVDLDMLKGGQIVTDEGSTEYNQYLRFTSADAFGSGKVVFGEDERDRVGHYLFWNDGDQVFEWELEFEEGLESEIEGDDLDDLEDEDLLILGQPFVIVDTDLIVTGGTGTTRLTLELMGGAISAILGENDKETYVVDGKEYEVEVLVISETSNNGEGSVKFRINGEISDELEDGETDVLADGTQIGVRDILATGKDIQKSIVQFYLGAYKLEFTDGNTSDTLNQSAGVEVNEETVEDSNVFIKGTVLVANRTFEIQNLKYRLFADAVLGDIYVPPGSGIREQLDEPEGMLTPAWDIIYQGLTDTGVTNVVIDPAGDDEYDLQFTNQEGIFYDVPLLSNENTDVGFKYGDDDDDLWFCESSNTSAYWVTDDDFFVLSNCDNATNDNTCFSHVLRYDSVDITNNQLTFTDLGTGTREVVFDNTTRKAELVVGGITYAVFVDPVAPQNISVDLKGDGLVDADCVEIGIQGEGLIILGRNNTNATTVQGPKATPAVFGGANSANGTNITLLTLAKEFDESAASEVIDIEFQLRANNQIGLVAAANPRARTGAGTTGGLFGPFDLEENEDLEQSLSLYGVFFEEFDPTGTDEAESLTIEYPLSQRGAEVYVTGGAVKTSVTETGFAEKVTPLSSAVSKLASEVEDVSDWNAVVVGGPCANPISAQLMGNPDPCWQAVPANKAIVKAFEHANGNVALLVAGRTAEDTRRATKAVAGGELKDVDSNEAEVSGTSMTDIQVNAV